MRELTPETGIFVPGLRLSERFYIEAVRPLLNLHYPDLAHAAGRFGSGSEVLGYDTARSADHEWGPRLQLILGTDDARRHGADLSRMLSLRLPKEFLGYPTNFASTGVDGGIGSMLRTNQPVKHRVEITDAESWFAVHLGFDPRRSISTLDWLATPWQRILEFTGGRVFRDDLGDITAGRHRLAWYPADVARHILASQWQRIGQEEAFPGRCAEVDDHLGSAIVTARLARDLMRLCLLLHRRYPPYSKWLGSAFRRLPGSAAIGDSLLAATTATNWSDREHHLVAAYEATVDLQNRRLGVALATTAGTYFERPYQVIHGDRIAAALRATITSDVIRRLPPIGCVDQWVDSTDALGDVTDLREAVARRLSLPMEPPH